MDVQFKGILATEDKYALLLNQIYLYDYEELGSKFLELDNVYHPLAKPGHKFRLANQEYNQRLLDALQNRDYLSNYQEENGELVGRVRQKRTLQMIENKQ